MSPEEIRKLIRKGIPQNKRDTMECGCFTYVQAFFPCEAHLMTDYESPKSSGV